MIGLIKANLIFIFYGTALLFILMSMTGRTRIPLYFLIWLMPLVNVSRKFHQFPFGKDYVDILIMVLFLGWFIGAKRERQPIMLPSPINGISIFMILYTFALLLMGSAYLHYVTLLDPGDPRVQAWKNFCILPVLFFLTYNNIRDKKSVWITVAVICLCMAAMNFYTVRQIRWFSSLASRTKIEGTFVYLGPNEIAAFYNQYTIILMSLFFSIRDWRIKGPLMWLIFVNLNCVLFLFSRAAYIGLFIGLALLFLFKKKVLLIPLVIAGILWHTALPQKVVERIESTWDDSGTLDESSERRLVVWKRSLDMFNRNPIVGVGFGVFREMGFELGDTHNIFLKILAEQGLVGMAIFLLLVVIMFFRGVLLYFNGDDDAARGLGLGFAVCVIVLAINNMFGDRWSYLPLSSNLWVFAGLVERMNWLARMKRQEARAQQTKKYVKQRYRQV